MGWGMEGYAKISSINNCGIGLAVYHLVQNGYMVIYGMVLLLMVILMDGWMIFMDSILWYNLLS